MFNSSVVLTERRRRINLSRRKFRWLFVSQVVRRLHGSLTVWTVRLHPWCINCLVHRLHTSWGRVLPGVWIQYDDVTTGLPGPTRKRDSVTKSSLYDVEDLTHVNPFLLLHVKTNNITNPRKWSWITGQQYKTVRTFGPDLWLPHGT